MDYPQNIKVETPLGFVFLAITERNHVHVSTNTEKLTVRGQQVRISCHLTFRDGKWSHKDKAGYSTLYAHRGIHFLETVTDTQAKKIIETVVPVVIDWLGKNNKMREQAQKSHIENEISNRQQDILELNQKIETLKKEIRDLEGQF